MTSRVITEELELGYLARIAEGGPGIVLVHDVWGLYDHFRDLSRRLADEGFTVLAVNLYRSIKDVRIEDVSAWMRGLSDPDMLASIQVAVDYLRAHPASTGRPTFVTGFCMGGMYALLAGASLQGIAAVAPFYGILSHQHGLLGGAPLDPAKKPVEPVEAAGRLKCPMLSFFGAEDVFISEDDVQLLRESVKRGTETAEIVVYPGAGHAFANDTRPQMYRPGPASDAWARMVSFFRQRSVELEAHD